MNIMARVCAVIALGVLAVSAQEFRATVTGRVADPSGGGIAAAKVTLTNQQTNEQHTAGTAQDGTYTAPFLKPGPYTLAVEATGFKRAVRENIQLFVNDKTTVDFELELGSVQDSVTVTAEAPLLEAATASRGGVIENLRVTELPLNGRNPFMLAGLTTGVQFAGNLIFTRPFDNGENVAWSINGGLRQTNAFQLDGAPNDAVTDADTGRTRAQNNIAYIPPVDAVQEFKVLTNFYDAQYGRTGGGIFNVVTKSGTNEFHGAAYEFMRRYQLDANLIENNRQGRPRYGVDPVTGENLGGHLLDQYGTNLTGPVLIPKLYNGKDRTFFMFGFENYRERVPEPRQLNVPTMLERGGDFSQSGIDIYDPFSTRDNPNFNPGEPESANNPRYIRDLFPGNVIPADRLNPVGANIVRTFPEPNVGDALLRANNFLNSPNLNQDKFRSWIARVDHGIGQKERLFFRYAHNRRNQFASNNFDGIGADRQDPLVRLNDGAVVDSVTVLSPATILNLRGSLTRFIQAAYRERVMPFDAASLGFPASFSGARPTAIPPRIDLEQYPTWGSRNPSQNTTNTLSFQPSLQHIRGRHSLKFGAEVRDIRANVRGGSFLYGGGYFRFSREFTRRLPQYQDSGSGNAIASLLLGAPAEGWVEYNPILAFRWGYYGFYIQDDWKLTSRLTLNVGLRYDVETAPTERYDQQNRGFAFDQASPLAGAVENASASDCPACADLRGGLLFANNNGLPRAAFDNDRNNWQPRVGAAYQLASRTVLRGGYGIFYLPEAVFGGTLGFGVQTPFVPTIGGGAAGYRPATTLDNPFPGGLLAPSGASAGLLTSAGNDLRFNSPERRIPYVHQFSFGVQHQVPWSVRLDASYVGSRTMGVNTNSFNGGDARNINDNTPDQYARARQDSSYFNQEVPNPFAGLLPGNRALNGPAIRRQQLLRPFPQFTNIFMGLEPVGKIWYDSLQTNVEKRFSNGLLFVAAWTWSKNLEALTFLNPYDVRPVKNLTVSDRPHRFVLSGVAQLPFGRGRHFGKGAGRGTDLLVGGWEYNWIATYQSGTPLDLPGNVDLVGNPEVEDRSFDRWFSNCVQQSNGTAACSSPAWRLRGPNTLRSIPFRSGQLRNPWRPQWDMALNKRFHIMERYSAQFRLEAFNVFNTPILGGPVTNPTDPNFGVVFRNQRNFPRNVQLGFKFNW